MDQTSEASYRKFLTSEQVDRRTILRHQASSPYKRKLQSP